ncbi:MAG: hypothetical protein NVSMB10_09790 [Steroidobacteraceae bacterium]
MKSKLLYMGALAAAVALVGACHNNDHGAAPPPPVATTKSLDTMAVLALAQQTSETAAPFTVNGGAVTIANTSETGNSLPINTM